MPGGAKATQAAATLHCRDLVRGQPTRRRRPCRAHEVKLGWELTSTLAHACGIAAHRHPGHGARHGVRAWGAGCALAAFRQRGAAVAVAALTRAPTQGRHTGAGANPTIFLESRVDEQ